VVAVRVVLVAPKQEGNVGAIARAMKNFDAEDLVLVNPCAIGDEARRRAMHGIAILERARVERDVTAALRGVDLVVGTSGVNTESEKRFVRIALPPREVAERAKEMDGRLAILFGREDFGLLDEELALCDILATIPASKEYGILNVSHAAAILLYEIFGASSPPRRVREASGLEKEKLHGSFAALLDVTEYPSHKRARTKIMFRRMLGRAVPSKWEFHALMGVLQRATKRIQRLEKER
jgi:TrmH family RNA methyltransferase